MTGRFFGLYSLLNVNVISEGYCSRGITWARHSVSVVVLCILAWYSLELNNCIALFLKRTENVAVSDIRSYFFLFILKHAFLIHKWKM